MARISYVIATVVLLSLVDLARVAAQPLPAVSAPNAKLEFDAGALSVPTPGFMARAAGTLTLPLGTAFGVQADFTAATAPGFTTGAALHVFTRDPHLYLFGGTLGMVRAPGAIVLAVGPEAELYLDRWTLEAWAGAALVRPAAGPDRVGPFAMADAGYYATDNWRLTVGLSYLDGYAAVHAGTEYMLDTAASAVSLTADARYGQDGAMRATAGLRVYFGMPGKSLIGRHREDDPADRSAALIASIGAGTAAGGGGSAPQGGSNGDPSPPDIGGGPTSCKYYEYWSVDHCVLIDLPPPPP